MQTYKIIGADQKEYGPVTVEQLRQWIAQGRANAQTRVRAENETDWRALADIPEFAPDLAAAAASPPPASPSTIGSLPQTAPNKTSGLAIASLIIGIFGILSCGILSPIGLILGIVSIVQISKSKGALGGKGFALTGTILSGVSLVMLPILAAMLLPALAKAKSKATTIVCVSNVRQLGLSARMFADEHTNQLPQAATWCDDLKPGVGGTDTVFKCPTAMLSSSSERSHYAFNARLGGMDIEKVSPQTVLIFETEGGWNVSGGSELMPKHSRHGRFFVVGFADGSVRQVPESELESLRWEP